MRNPANKQTIKQNILATQRFELSTLKFLAQCSYWLSFRALLILLVLSDYYYSPFSPNLTKNRTSNLWEILLTNKQTNRQTKIFGHTDVRTLDPRVFSTMLLPTDL